MEDSLKRKNVIVTLSFEFAVEMIGFCTVLDDMKKWSLSNQILRASISIGANVKEAQNAESRADFIHKMKIAAKEADEVEYYLEICNAAKELPDAGIMLEKVQSICKVLNKIIGSSKGVKI